MCQKYKGTSSTDYGTDAMHNVCIPQYISFMTPARVKQEVGANKNVKAV